MQSRQYDADVLAAGKPGRRRQGQREGTQGRGRTRPGSGGLRGPVLRRGGRLREGRRHAGGPARPAWGSSRSPRARSCSRARRSRSSRPVSISGHPPVRPGPPPDRWPRRRAGPRWLAPAASTSRASTTPSSSSRSGAMTCATSAWWSSTWRASTTCRPLSRTSPPHPVADWGWLVDHLVAGSKETRIVAGVWSPHVLIVGHPFIDIWAAVRPSSVGIPAWPRVPPGQPWKEGVLRAIGWLPRGADGLEAHPAFGQELRRPGARTSGAGRGAHRFRHHARKRIA